MKKGERPLLKILGGGKSESRDSEQKSADKRRNELVSTNVVFTARGLETRDDGNVGA